MQTLRCVREHAERAVGANARVDVGRGADPADRCSCARRGADDMRSDGRTPSRQSGSSRFPRLVSSRTHALPSRCSKAARSCWRGRSQRPRATFGSACLVSHDALAAARDVVPLLVAIRDAVRSRLPSRRPVESNRRGRRSDVSLDCFKSASSRSLETRRASCCAFIRMLFLPRSTNADTFVRSVSGSYGLKR